MDTSKSRGARSSGSRGIFAHQKTQALTGDFACVFPQRRAFCGQMKPKRQTYKFFLPGGLALVALRALALPLRTADVPEDPAWIAHLDCDALRSNSVGKFILAE